MSSRSRAAAYPDPRKHIWAVDTKLVVAS